MIDFKPIEDVNNPGDPILAPMLIHCLLDGIESAQKELGDDVTVVEEMSLHAGIRLILKPEYHELFEMVIEERKNNPEPV